MTTVSDKTDSFCNSTVSDKVKKDANGFETMDTALENGYNNAGNWSPDGDLYNPPTSTESYEGTMY